MKRRCMALLFMCVMAVSLLAGCGSGSSDTDTSADSDSADTAAESADTVEADTEASGETKEFYCVVPFLAMEYWSICSNGVEAADAEYNCNTQVTSPTDSDTALTEIVNVMESVIASNPDGIICYAGFDTFPALLEEAAAAGIPVVTIDSDCSDTTNRIAYAGTEPYNAGYASGEAMIEATGGEGTVAILTSTVSSEKE